MEKNVCILETKYVHHSDKLTEVTHYAQTLLEKITQLTNTVKRSNLCKSKDYERSCQNIHVNGILPDGSANKSGNEKINSMSLKEQKLIDICSVANLSNTELWNDINPTNAEEDDSINVSPEVETNVNTLGNISTCNKSAKSDFSNFFSSKHKEEDNQNGSIEDCSADENNQTAESFLDEIKIDDSICNILRVQCSVTLENKSSLITSPTEKTSSNDTNCKEHVYDTNEDRQSIDLGDSRSKSVHDRNQCGFKTKETNTDIDNRVSFHQKKQCYEGTVQLPCIDVSPSVNDLPNITTDKG